MDSIVYFVGFEEKRNGKAGLRANRPCATIDHSNIGEISTTTLPEAEVVAVQEFRISRYQLLVSIKCLLTLLLIPIGVSLIVKVCFIRPVTEYFWNGHQTDLF
jgi:hypothetical protein